MSVRIVPALAPGRIAAYADLYGMSVNPVVDTLSVVARQQVQINQVSDDTRKLWKIGFCFCGTTLKTGLA